MKVTQTAVLVKPDGLQRGLIGEIISRFERKGLKLVGLKMLRMDDRQLDEWYSEHREKEFFHDLKTFMSSMPIVAMVWEGIDAVPVVRLLVGTTLGREAEGGSIRGDFGMSQQMNLIHALIKMRFFIITASPKQSFMQWVRLNLMMKKTNLTLHLHLKICHNVFR